MYNLAEKPIELPVLDVSKYEFSQEAQRKTSSILYFRRASKDKTDEEHQTVKRCRRPDIPFWEKSSLTIDEAAAYSGVGRDKLREMTDREDCPFVLWIGSKRLIRREKFDAYLDRAFSI